MLIVLLMSLVWLLAYFRVKLWVSTIVVTTYLEDRTRGSRGKHGCLVDLYTGGGTRE